MITVSGARVARGGSSLAVARAAGSVRNNTNVPGRMESTSGVESITYDGCQCAFAPSCCSRRPRCSPQRSRRRSCLRFRSRLQPSAGRFPPARFEWLGRPMPICARCLGVYAGLLAAALRPPRMPSAVVWTFAGVNGVDSGIRHRAERAPLRSRVRILLGRRGSVACLAQTHCVKLNCA